MSLHSSVTESLEALERDPRDLGARDLAVTYAAQIDDDPELLEPLGPKLLAVLESLGLTPRARAATTKGGTGAAAANPLDQLRDRRQQRAGIGTAAPVDAPTA